MRIDRRRFVKLAALTPTVLRAREEYFPAPDTAGGWRTRNPDSLARALLDRAFESAAGSTKHGGLLVVKDGWLVYEKYFGLGNREVTPNAASCGKAFTSIAFGIFFHEHPELFPDGFDQKVYTPRYLPSEAFPLNDPAKSEIKLGQLLTMTAGLAGNNPGYVMGKPIKLAQTGPDGWKAVVDQNAYNTPMWTKPGGGWCYATVSPHLVSIIIRHGSGMEMQQYLQQKVAQPLGWGRWGFAYQRREVIHTPGGGAIAIRPTDMLRFGYLLLREGRWAGRQIVPASYLRQCGTASPYNPHYPFSFQFDVNAEGKAVEGAPHDAFWKGGSGGYVIYAVPSLDLVIYKLGGRDEQYNLALTNVPPPPSGMPPYDGLRELWKQPHPEPDATGDVLRLVSQAFR